MTPKKPELTREELILRLRKVTQENRDLRGRLKAIAHWCKVKRIDPGPR